MKMTRITRYEIIGSICSWPVEIDLSRNNRRGVWKIYLRYTDPDLLSTETIEFASPDKLAAILEENSIDAAEFAHELTAATNNELRELGAQLCRRSLKR